MSNVDLVRIAPDLLSALGEVDLSGIQSAGDLTDQITGEVAAALSAVIGREENPRISRAVQLKFVQRDGWKLDTEDEGFTDVFDIMTGGVRALAG